MSIPDWWAFILLGVASWRTFQLLAFDEILDRPRRYMLRLGDEWQTQGDELPEGYRLQLAQFITCPYCAGTWIATAWWITFQITERWTLVAASLVALWVIPIIGHKLLARDEDK